MSRRENRGALHAMFNSRLMVSLLLLLLMTKSVSGWMTTLPTSSTFIKSSSSRGDVRNYNFKVKGHSRWLKVSHSNDNNQCIHSRSYTQFQLSSKKSSSSMASSTNQSTSANRVHDRIESLEITDELRQSFLSYALSTILGRALPDGRDGLKPVQRRVLYAMHVLRLYPDVGYRKCARVVGEVLGKYHPHGDQSVYEALVRMAQDFVMLHPLISGHGNFGSIDNDPAAAMRYTESKLSSLAADALLADLKENTVDFIPNFDGNEEEPIVLPARLPLALLNGVSGIAVGMSTSIPPHNLGEIATALVALIDNPNLSNETLRKLVPGPDFPTGGLILSSQGSALLHSTGNGGIRLQARYHFEVLSSSGATISVQQPLAIAGDDSTNTTNNLQAKQMSKINSKKPSMTATTPSITGRTKNAIVITELPYMSNKAAILESLAELVNDKKIEGISDLRDESDRDGIRVVIELRKDALPELVIKNLFMKTGLSSVFSGNMLVLGDEGRTPMRMSLREMLEQFIKFRVETIRRRTQFRLNALAARSHLVGGLQVALARIDEVIADVRKCKDFAAIKSVFISRYNMSEIQAEAVANLRLSKLSTLEVDQLRVESEQLKVQIANLQSCLDNRSKLFDIMKNETLELKTKYNIPRKTQILADAHVQLTTEDLIENSRSVICVTASGYAKRLPISEFDLQSRGGRGKLGLTLSSNNDSVTNFFACNDHDSIVFVSKRGIAYRVKAYKIPLCSRTSRGTPLPQIVNIHDSDELAAVLPIPSEASLDVDTSAHPHDDVGAAGADENVNVNDNCLLVTAENELFLLLVTANGLVKRTPLRLLLSTSAGRGVRAIALSSSRDRVKWARVCNSSAEIMLATEQGFVVRFPTSDQPATGRNSMGTKAITLRDGDKLVDVDIFSPSRDVGRPQYVLMVTRQGYSKRTPLGDFAPISRGGKGLSAIKFKKTTLHHTTASTGKKSRGKKTENLLMPNSDALQCLRICTEDEEAVVSTRKGVIIRSRVIETSTKSRQGTGSLLQRLDDDDFVSLLDVVGSETNHL